MVVHNMIAKTRTRPSQKVEIPLSLTPLVFSRLIIVEQKMLAETRVELKVEFQEDGDLEGLSLIIIVFAILF